MSECTAVTDECMPPNGVLGHKKKKQKTRRVACTIAQDNLSFTITGQETSVELEETKTGKTVQKGFSLKKPA